MPNITSGGGLVTGDNIIDGSIANADVAANAAISTTKIAGEPYELLTVATQSSGAATLTTSTFSGKKHLRLLIYLAGSGNASLNLQFNGDTSTNYDFVKETNNGGVASGTGGTGIEIENTASTAERFFVVDIYNVASKAKKVLSRSITTTSMNHAGGSWSNTTNLITSVTLFIDDVGNINAGSEITVLGMN